MIKKVGNWYYGNGTCFTECCANDDPVHLWGCANARVRISSDKVRKLNKFQYFMVKYYWNAIELIHIGKISSNHKDLVLGNVKLSEVRTF